MSRLLVRIFLSFWLMIVLTIGAAAALGYYYAERAHAAIARFEVSEAMVEASEALRAHGRAGLVRWLDSLPGVTGSLIYVVDSRGRDILGRRLPAPVSMALRRFGAHHGSGLPRDRGNLRPARPFTELVGSDGKVYTIFVLPPRGVVGNWFANRGLTSVMVLAVLVSAGVSWLLAGTISRPVRQLRDSAMSIAAGKLDTRVAADVAGRRDELGRLARDFDRMAGELQRSLERQTELTRNISHELRSPLARLRVALELARRKSSESSLFDKIEAETEKLDALIAQILEFSKLDADDRGQATSINVADLVHSIVEDVQFEYGDDVSVALDELPADDVFVKGNEIALRAGIENVVRNAARHGRTRGEIRVALKREPSVAVVTVQDDGGGVAPEELERLFEPFYRAAPYRAESARRGAGLGLAIAKRAIERHDGSISAQNRGGGLSVTIRIPL